jgi:hypothetical protein
MDGDYDGEAFSLILSNDLLTQDPPPATMYISGLSYAFLNSPVALEALNGQNEYLAALFQPADPSEFELNPGETLFLTLQGDAPPDGFVVVYYEVFAQDSMAFVRGYVQMSVTGQ